MQIVEADLDRPASRLVRAGYGVRRLFSEGDSAQAVATTTGDRGNRR